MINKVSLKNFGPITNLDWNDLGRINLVIGENGKGKTFLLKALYCLVKTVEEFRRGNDQKTTNEILVEKLRWTFQIEKIGDLVSKGAEQPLEFTAKFCNHRFHYQLGKETTRLIPLVENNTEKRDFDSIFLPAKEVLSLHNLILTSRDIDKVFGFDDTYVDLVRAVSSLPRGGRNYVNFAKARTDLKGIINGQVVYDESSASWIYKKGNQKFSIGATAEGIKKIGILDTLLRNRYLSPGSIILIDEPESALHPRAISNFLDIIADLSNDFQFFLASHSYFVIKKLYLIAQERNISIPVISGSGSGWTTDDLLEGMSDNPIIDESIKLYRKEISL